MSSIDHPLSINLLDEDLGINASFKEEIEKDSRFSSKCLDSVAKIADLAQGNLLLSIEYFNQLPKQGFDFTSLIVIVVVDELQDGLEALKRGAQDFVVASKGLDSLYETLKKTILRQVLSQSPDHVRAKPLSVEIISENAQMLSILEKVEQLASYDTTLLVEGESGTGKELIARTLHNQSPRSNGPFVAINCGAIPEMLIESELFGHKAGSFTDARADKVGLMEEADGGTLFLDEIAEMPLHLQVKLLRVLQERKLRRVGEEQLRPIDIRVVAATNKDLMAEVKNGNFREDLFYRLNIVNIALPPLRQRGNDVLLLARFFADKLTNRFNLDPKSFSGEVREFFVKYSWPGNIRELENVIERAIVLCDGDEITVNELPSSLRQSGSLEHNTSLFGKISDDNLSIKHWGQRLEKLLISKALDKTSGNRTHAAKLLEVSHRTLLYKLKEYEIS